MEAEIITRDYLRDFFRLSESETDINLLNNIMSHLKLQEYSHNHYIYKRGDKATHIYFIESGAVLVKDKNGDIINELQQGSVFGEYSIFSGDNRTSDILTHGTVRVYEFDKETLLEFARQHQEIFGTFLRNLYAQSAQRYRKLVKLLNLRRGYSSRSSKKKTTLTSLLLNWAFVAAVFLLTMFFAPNPAAVEKMPALWLCAPIFFMVIYMFITKRALETLVVSTLYVMLLLSKTGFIGKFSDYLLFKTGNVVDIIIIILLMGSMTKLFSASGSINALRDLINRKIKSAPGTMFSGFLTMVLIAFDEYLSLLINGVCFRPLLDGKKIPREKTAIVMGMTPSALCILSPLSIIGIYLTGIIAMATEGNRYLFLETIRYNYGAFFMVIFVLFLIAKKLPLFGGLKRAEIRVKENGPLWPEGTEESELEIEQSKGRLINLFLPVLVFIVSSIVSGTLASGVFQVNVLYGMCITMIFIFIFYCAQQYMTPDQFFKHFIYGIENMIFPVVIFTLGKCFAYGMIDLGFTDWLNESVHNLIGEQVWLLAPMVFIVGVLVAALLNDHWAMFAICIPFAVRLAESFNGNIALYLGAVCAAGLLGNELDSENIDVIGSTLGINYKSYYRAKLPYIIILIILTLGAYMLTGFLKL